MRVATVGIRGGLLLLLLLSGCKEPRPTPPVPPQPEDPIVQILVPGAYGIPGGNQVYNEDRHQLSSMECPDGTLLLRILDPGERKVLSIHSVPAKLRQGDRIPLHYRVMVNGYTIQSQSYTDVLVVKVTDSNIWLRKDETTYFVLQR